jgi:predicted membrane channel-forming protein YqfA (hemolysin III family)
MSRSRYLSPQTAQEKEWMGQFLQTLIENMVFFGVALLLIPTMAIVNQLSGFLLIIFVFVLVAFAIGVILVVYPLWSGRLTWADRIRVLELSGGFFLTLGLMLTFVCLTNQSELGILPIFGIAWGLLELGVAVGAKRLMQRIVLESVARLMSR